MWTCVVCTLENSDRLKKCDACGTKRNVNASKIRKEKYTCPHCGATILWPKNLSRVRCGGCQRVLSKEEGGSNKVMSAQRRKIPLSNIVHRSGDRSNNQLLFTVTVDDGPDMYVLTTQLSCIFDSLPKIQHTGIHLNNSCPCHVFAVLLRGSHQST